MPRAIVVVESMFGNTRQVADAVADGVRTACEVEVVAVADAPVAPGADLLVVGGPTHAFGLSRSSTRAEAVRRGAPARPSDAARGLREYLGEVRLPSYPLQVAAFDTRVRKRGAPGSAARAAQRRLARRGGQSVLPPESFWVADLRGPLVPGELERARTWGERLGATLTLAAR